MRRGTAGILGIYWAIPTTPVISRRAACRRWLVSVCDGNVWQLLSGEWCFVFQNWKNAFNMLLVKRPLYATTGHGWSLWKYFARKVEWMLQILKRTLHLLKIPSLPWRQAETRNVPHSKVGSHRAFIMHSSSHDRLLLGSFQFLFSTTCKMGQLSYVGDVAQQRIRFTHENRRKASRLKRRNTAQWNL